MSASGGSQSTHTGGGGSASSQSRHRSRILTQTSIDAKLHSNFEQSGSSFDYSASIHLTNNPPTTTTAAAGTTAYLHSIQKSNLIQPFGCLLALHPTTLKLIAYTQNAPEFLATVSHTVPTISDRPLLAFGTDLRTIFTAPTATALLKALAFPDVTLLNPILVHSRSSGKPFYAILHRVTGSLIIDFEPVKPDEVPVTAAGALQSYKLAAKAITRLQALPSGSMARLCDTMVQEVFELTGYDRVMAYKFHDDDHGEVFSEVTKPGLEPYLGLHYPATDIPQAARFLFMKNKVRMIVDCKAKNVKVIQDPNHEFDLTLCGSTLRAPHSCHLQYMENMNSIASLVMAIVVNEENEDDEFEHKNEVSLQKNRRKRLWGLVVCHNTTPRFVPFPLRYACEFLAQVFAIHVNKELELENQILEKNILRTQTLLCDMLMRDAPLGIVSRSPNIMDLVKSDGAALLYNNKIWRLGITPTDFHLHDIASWIMEYHVDFTGLSTDSLYDAEYPGALSLGDDVCGMAAVRIASDDMIFWFRSHTASEIRWGGAKHEAGVKDDGTKMHPRSSFKAFLEVVKTRSLPWKDFEMDAIHSLQLILRNSYNKEADIDHNRKSIQSTLSELKIDGRQELESVTNEMVRLIETATVPILAVDMDGFVNGWNSKIAELTGLSVEKAIGKHLLTLVEDSSVQTVNKMLFLALQGEEEKNVEFELKREGSELETGSSTNNIRLIVNACGSKDVNENVVGVCMVAQDITQEKKVMDKFTKLQGDYKAIVQNPNPLIPPIFGVDEFGWCSEWNMAMEKVSGWSRDEVLNKMLLGEVFGTCCHLKNREAFVKLGIVLNNAMSGEETETISFGFFDRNGVFVECFVCVNKIMDENGEVVGVFCFLQLASQELQQALNVQKLCERTALKRLKVLGYVKRQIQSPLCGIVFSRKMLERTELGDEQKQLLINGANCQAQISKVLLESSLDLDNIFQGLIDLEMVEFSLYEVLVVSMSQVMMKSKGKGIEIVNEVAEEIMTETFFGDSLRVQQVIADFLLTSVTYAPTGSQLIMLSTVLAMDHYPNSLNLVHVQLSIKYVGGGIPEALLNEMFGNDENASEEGFSLLVSRKLVKLMNGDVRYVREATNSTFIITLELATPHMLIKEE